MKGHFMAPSHRGRGLALVGYRGTGKTTVGRLLAERMNRSFVDVDLEIEALGPFDRRDFFAIG